MDEFEAFVLGEVGVVLDVERGEGKPADEAAGGDPGVVRRPGTAAELGVGLDLAPAGGDLLVLGEDDEFSEEGPHRLQAARAPVADEGPLRELAVGDEGDGDVWPVSFRARLTGVRRRRSVEATSVSTTTRLTRARRAGRP